MGATASSPTQQPMESRIWKPSIHHRRLQSAFAVPLQK
jgi:hypothetical protein